MRPTVLIVDDHEGFRQSASALLEAEGFSVEVRDGILPEPFTPLSTVIATRR